MLFDSLINFGLMVVEGFLSLANAVSLPFDMVNAAVTAAGYGSYVLGADLLLIVFGSLAFWFSTRFTVAILTFILSFIPTMSPK